MILSFHLLLYSHDQGQASLASEAALVEKQVGWDVMRAEHIQIKLSYSSWLSKYCMVNLFIF